MGPGTGNYNCYNEEFVIVFWTLGPQSDKRVLVSGVKEGLETEETAHLLAYYPTQPRP